MSQAQQRPGPPLSGPGNEAKDPTIGLARNVFAAVIPLFLGLGLLVIVMLPAETSRSLGLAILAAAGAVAFLYLVVLPRVRTIHQSQAVALVYNTVVLAIALYAVVLDAPRMMPGLLIAITGAGIFFRHVGWYLAVVVVYLAAWALSLRITGYVPTTVDLIYYAYLGPCTGLLIQAVLRRYSDAIRDRADERTTRLARAVARYESEASERERVQSELRVARERLDRKQRLESLGLMAGGVAHDFNNMLVGIMGHASLAKLPDRSAGDMREHLSQIENGAERAAELCGNLLTFTGSRPLDKRPSDLNELARQIDRLLIRALPENVSLSLDVARDLPRLEIDRSQLQTVLLNIIVNASEAMPPEGGNIVVRTRAAELDQEYFSQAHTTDPLPSGRYAILEVSDDGTGMSGDTLGRLFEPFFTTKAQGKGLGLSSALGTIRSHGGAISVKSRLGFGTSFELALPALHDLPESTDETSHPGILVPEAPAETRSRTVLVVDDEQAIRDFLMRALEHEGYRVLVAGGARAAIDQVTDALDSIDAIVLDMIMPDGDGSEVLGEIRSRGCKAPVILSSGYAEQQVLRETTDDVQGFLSKPYRIETLLHEVRSVIAGPTIN
ncbi:hypothetical protein ABI59_22995 [Acidobacteria bacterium Mor1]|nr:hypothetical protein ABI59_22995 [Acidobacteria bacterium Mor1]